MAGKTDWQNHWKSSGFYGKCVNRPLWWELWFKCVQAKNRRSRHCSYVSELLCSSRHNSYYNRVLQRERNFKRYLNSLSMSCKSVRSECIAAGLSRDCIKADGWTVSRKYFYVFQGCTADLRPNSVLGNQFISCDYSKVQLFAGRFFECCQKAIADGGKKIELSSDCYLQSRVNGDSFR